MCHCGLKNLSGLLLAISFFFFGLAIYSCFILATREWQTERLIGIVGSILISKFTFGAALYLLRRVWGK